MSAIIFFLLLSVPFFSEKGVIKETKIIGYKDIINNIIIQNNIIISFINNSKYYNSILIKIELYFGCIILYL